MASPAMASSASGDDDFPGDEGLSDDSFSSNDSDSGWQVHSDDDDVPEDANAQPRRDDDAGGGGGPPASLASITTQPSLPGLRKGFLLVPKPKKNREAAAGDVQRTTTDDHSRNDDHNRKQPSSSVNTRPALPSVASVGTTQHPSKKLSAADSADKSPVTKRKKNTPPPTGSAAPVTAAARESRTSGTSESEHPIEEWPCNFGECDVHQPITSAENYLQISCLSDCMLRLHPECFKRALAKQNIDTRKKKNIKNPSCITPDCGAAMYEIHEHHVNNETTLYKRCCEAPIDKKPEPAKKHPVLKLPKDFFATMKTEQRANSEQMKEVDNKPSYQSVFDMRPVEPKTDSVVPAPPPDIMPAPPPNIAAVPLKREEDVDLKYKIAEDNGSKKKGKKQRDKPKAQLLQTEFTFASDNNRMQLNYGSSTEFVGGGGAAYDGVSRLNDYRRPSETYSNDDDDFGLPIMNLVPAHEPVAVAAAPRQPTEQSAVVTLRSAVPDIADRAVLSHMEGEVYRILPEIQPILTEIASELCIMGMPVSIEEFGQMVCSRTSELWLGDQQTVSDIVKSGYTNMLVVRSQLFRFDPQKNLVSSLEDLNRSASPADGDAESGIGDDDDSSKAMSADPLVFSSKQALDDIIGGAFKKTMFPSTVEVRTVTTASSSGQVDVSQHVDESSTSDTDDNTQVDVNEQLLAAKAKLEVDLEAEKDRITQMKRQHKVELDAIMDDNSSLEAKVTELNGKLVAAQNKEKEQLRKIASLEKEIKELKERLSKLNVDDTDNDEVKRQNEDLREQLRAVELSHNENDRTHRAIIARFSNRAEYAETALLTIKCEVESRSLLRKLQDTENNVGHTQLIIERIRVHGASNNDLVAWITYNNEWKKIAATIKASIENIKIEYSHMIEEIGSGRKTLSDFNPVKIPETPPPPLMPPLPMNAAAVGRDLQQPSPTGQQRSTTPFMNKMPAPPAALRQATGTPPGLERQHFVQQREPDRPPSNASSQAASNSQLPKESSAAAGGAPTGGGGRDKLQKLIAEVRRKLPDADEKTVTAAMGKLRRDKWNGALPKNMRVIIAEVVQYLAQASQTERTTAWVTAQAAASAPRDARAILAGGHECKICLMSCLSGQDLSACSACSEPYHRPCVNEWLQRSTGTGDCPNCRKPWLSPEDFPSLQ